MIDLMFSAVPSGEGEGLVYIVMINTLTRKLYT
jgi:hypothetical protein